MKKNPGWGRQAREISGLIAAVWSAVWAIDAARDVARSTCSACGCAYVAALNAFALTLAPLLVPFVLWCIAPRGSASARLFGRATLLPALIWATAGLFLWFGPALIARGH